MANALRLLLLASAASGGCLIAVPAWSQDAPQEANRDGAIQDIVVTAQRRAESLQNVPIAITAISGEALAATGVSVTADLIAVTPGLNYTVNAGVYAQAKIRGIGTSSNGPGIENPVATYIDGVYIGSMSGALLNLSDVEQVAVLKGPQGTLFGRNATGGLIQITTRTPGQSPAADLRVGYGNLQTFTGSAYLNGGIAPSLAVNGSIYYQNRGKGFGKNFFNGQDVYKSRTIAARGKMRWEPGTGTAITLSADYSKVQGPLDGLRTVAGTYNVLGQQFNGGPYDVIENVQPAARLEQHGYSATIAQDVGPIQLQSITAYRETLNRTDLDYDKTQLPLTNVFIRQYDRQLSQELQLEPRSKGKLQWIVGAFYYWARSGYDNTVTNGSNLPNGISQIQNSSQTVNSLAAYAQATYPIFPETNLTAGVRYTTDLRKENGRSDAVLPNGIIAATSLSTGRERFSKVTYRFSLDHRFSPELLAYASYNRGFKSGAFLLQLFPSDILRPETLDAFEVGVKSDLLDRRVRFNAAAFYYDYTNIQIQLVNRGLLTAYNGSGAKFYGLDADLTANVTRAFTLNVGASYLHDEYKAFRSFTATPITPVFPPPVGRPNGGNLIGIGDATGNRVQAAPSFTLNVGGNYRIDVGRGHVDLNGNFYHNGGWYAETDNRLRQRPYSLVNASIAYSPGIKGFTLTAYAKNLTNTAYAAYLGEADVGDNITPAEGRTYGVTLSFRY